MRQDDGGGYAPPWVQSVTLAEIARQRELGWPDFHPEQFCHRCGNKNLRGWHAETEQWYQAMQVRDTDGGGIVCPICFAELWEGQTGLTRILWTLSIDPRSGDFDKVPPPPDGEGP